MATLPRTTDKKMKCVECEFFIKNECVKGQNLSLVDDPICLQKMTIILLKSIMEEVSYIADNIEDTEEGEDWKQ